MGYFETWFDRQKMQLIKLAYKKILKKFYNMAKILIIFLYFWGKNRPILPHWDL